MKNTYMTSDEINRFKAYMVRAGYNITSLGGKLKQKMQK